jgi:DNA-binding response OmpR family regulator
VLVLVVEDDARLAALIKRVLEDERHFVDLASDGAAGLQQGLNHNYDAIVLDVMLPVMDGFEVCKRLREARNDTPVLMLTARDAVEDRVRGLDAGADDYVAKPFAFTELLARLRALGRRRSDTGGAVLSIDDLTLDPDRHVVRRGSRDIELTPREFSLLEYLLRHPGQVLTRSQITDSVWGDAFDTMTNVVDTYIHYLRKKVDGGPGRKLIRTVRGFGYKIEERT